MNFTKMRWRRKKEELWYLGIKWNSVNKHRVNHRITAVIKLDTAGADCSMKVDSYGEFFLLKEKSN